MVRQFKLKTHSFVLNRHFISIPFEIVIQTDSLVIEKYVSKTWPSLMKHAQYSMDQLKELALMKAYIRRKMSQEDKEKIVKYLFDNSYANYIPQRKYSNILKMQITQVDAKMWTNELPFLEIDGYFIINIYEMVDYWFKNNYISLTNKKALTKEKIFLRMMKPFPSIVMSSTAETIKQIMLNYVQDLLDKRNVNYLKTKIERQIKLKNFHEFKKTYRWSNNDLLEIEVKDTIKLIKQKHGGKILPMAVGYLMLQNSRSKR